MSNKLKAIIIIITLSISLMAIKESDNISLPTTKVTPSPYDLQQNNRTLARDLTSPGTIPGKTIWNLGGPEGVSIDGKQGIFAGSVDFSAAPFNVDLDGNVKATSLTADGVDATTGTFQNVTIKDANGNTISDGVGLVSSTQFNNGLVSVANSGGTFTNNTNMSIDVPNLSIGLTLARQANVYLFSQVGGSVAGVGNNTDRAFYQIAVDGSLVGGPVSLTGSHYHSGAMILPAAVQYASITTIITLAAGSHTISVRYATSNAANGVFGTDLNQILGYIVLGK